MSYNGSGTFVINSAGQPVVTGTVISSTAFNALTADLATGLSTAITKDGQTTTTARILFAQGVSSTLVTDATSATTGSIITAGGISSQKALWIGTTSKLVGLVTANAGISSTLVTDATSTTTGSIITAGGISTQKALWVGTTSRLVGNTQHDGLVGIGMTPVNVLDITQNQNGGSYAKILNSNAGAGADSGFVGGNGTSTITVASYGTAASTFGALTAGMGYIYANAASGLAILSAGVLKFTANGSAEVARFDTSGNLQVGGTTGSGQISITKASLPTFSILKTGIVEVVHTIDAANVYTFGNGASGFQMNMGGGPYIAPGTDNVMTLGTSSFRWTTVYATTGTINTSDATTKQWLGDFNATEMAVASDIFAEIGSYKFLDAMEEKGDKARIHVGVRAQNVEQAFTKQGLTGFDYGLLCFDKWEDDVTEGAKAGQRYGIRNDELHYFLIAALEKRLKASEAAVAELTTRLSALESK